MAVETNNLDYDCDWRMGFNLESSAKGTVGYLLFWSGCGGLGLQKDIEVWNPYTGAGQTVVSGATIKCIGLLESFRFEGEADSPIRIVCYVSKETAANVRAKVAKPISSTSLQVSFYIVSYDDEEKAWFEAVLVKESGRVQASLDTTGGVLQLFVENKPERVDPRLDLKVYRLEFQIIPPPDASAVLEFATGPQQKRVVRWASE